MADLLRKSVACLILYDKDKKILMQHRTEDANYLPGYWGLFGGKIEDGETPEQAVKRELMEEIEYRSERPDFLFRREYDQNDFRLETHIFMERYDESQPIVLHEGQGYGWFTVDEVKKLKITERRMEDLMKIKEYLDSK